MSRTPATIKSLQWALGCALILSALVGWFFLNQSIWPRGEALLVALTPLIKQAGSDQALVGQAIWDNYLEARTNASWWSGIYFGFTFAAAALSALAGLILKFEYIIKTDAIKKDVAALMAVGAALLITVSTSGDFQRKWQANRIAAAELERLGYQLLETGADQPKRYFPLMGKVLLDRHTAIVGSGAPAGVPGKAASAPP